MNSATPHALLPQQGPSRPRRLLDRGRLPMHVVLIIAALLVMLPGYFMIITSLKSQDDYSLNKTGLPQQIVLQKLRYRDEGRAAASLAPE